MEAARDAEEAEFQRQLSKADLTIESFVNEESLFEMLVPSKRGELAPCALLDGEWMLKRAAKLHSLSRDARKKYALPRRQYLERHHPEAFMSAATLRKLERGDERINSPLPLVCVSHCWHSRDHPDPYGDNLLIIEEAVIKARNVERFPAGKFAVFFDWVSLHQRDKRGRRTAKEQTAFGHALSKMQLWYAHMKTIVFLLTETPQGWPAESKPYTERGWPSFERMITMILKHQSKKCWATICDVGAFAEGGVGRTVLEPPKDVHSFEEMLNTVEFTNGADRRTVLALYRETLHVALGQARSLRYTGLQWGDGEMGGLTRVLPLCKNLVYLNLKGAHNKYTADAAASLAAVLRDEQHLPRLKMIGAGCNAKEKDDQGPLLEDAELRRICEVRGVKLLRDVPFELVQPHFHSSSRQSGHLHWGLFRQLHAAMRRSHEEGHEVRRRRSSVAVSLGSYANLASLVAGLPGRVSSRADSWSKWRSSSLSERPSDLAISGEESSVFNEEDTKELDRSVAT